LSFLGHFRHNLVFVGREAVEQMSENNGIWLKLHCPWINCVASVALLLMPISLSLGWIRALII
jgi:hypothetical protein